MPPTWAWHELGHAQTPSDEVSQAANHPVALTVVGFKEKLEAKIDKLGNKLEKLPSDLSRLKESVAFSINPNHRHDEAWEKEIDRIRTEIAKSHRFESFGAPREGNVAKWFIDGHDYFYALSTILDEAQESIQILDWWLTPELFLRRPPTKHEDFRLDRLLLKKAEQGVKIQIIVYKEVTQTMTMSSSHTKHHMEDMHENIAVMRHPDHLGGEITLMWSHHEKLVIVDNTIACVGGLDICFGRWDTNIGILSDVHPSDFSASLFLGQDYNNARVQDFQAVEHWVSNQQSRLTTPRMPWHDIHCQLAGPVVMDLAQHFVERWNFVRSLKYKHEDRYLELAFPHVVGEDENPIPSIVRHPHLHAWAESGRAFTRHALGQDEPEAIKPFGGLGPKGDMRAQICRSSADWSHGILTEHSIQNAYIQMIQEAVHCIYIQNQFFITATKEGLPVKNLIGRALVSRILSAARSGKKFKVVIVIPAIPGFSGDLKGNSGNLAIMLSSYLSISRGPNSIFETIKREGFNPDDYIRFYHLRSYDRINNDPEYFEEKAKEAGLDYDTAAAALGRVALGPDAYEKELKLNKEVHFTLAKEGGEAETFDTDKEQKTRKDANEVVITMPDGYDEAWEQVHKFEKAGSKGKDVVDSVAHHQMKWDGSLLDEPWSGTEDSERAAYVQEELYIHSKLLIVDDRRCLIGSANLNDRSMNGDHDSEIAVIVEDPETIESEMDGKPYVANKFACSLRRQLWKQHLGLLEPQFCPDVRNEPVTDSMRPVGYPNTDKTFDSEEDRIVMDPLSEELIERWHGTAVENEKIFEDVFHTVPTNQVKTWDEYSKYHVHKPNLIGHVYDSKRPVRDIKEQLAKVRGHLVPAPTEFLINENLAEFDVTVNPLTLDIYL